MSLFARAIAAANNTILSAFGDEVIVDGIVGNGIVSFGPTMELGGGIDLINGANFDFLAADFPQIAVNSMVEATDLQFIVTHLSDTDSNGRRMARLARV